MSEGGEDEPHEVSVEIRDEFQRQVIEYIKEARSESQIVNRGQFPKTLEEVHHTVVYIPITYVQQLTS